MRRINCKYAERHIAKNRFRHYNGHLGGGDLKTQLSSAEYDEVLACIEAIYGCRSLDDFPRHVLTELRKLIPCTFSGYNEVNVPRDRLIAVLDPPQPQLASLLQNFGKYISQHPVVHYMNATGDGQALKISDFVGVRDYRKSVVYQEFFQQIGVEDQLAIGIRAENGFVIGIAFNRADRSFTEKDRLRLNLLRPHVIQAYVHAQERAGHLEQLTDLQKALGENGRGLIAINDKGTLIHATPGAFETLARYIPVPETGKAKLPAHLLKWARESTDISEPLTLHRDSQRLIIRRVKHSDRTLVLMSEGRDVMDTRELARFKLTPRETEVLHWLAEGKSNSEIASVLGLTSGTVKLHVERVLAKLSVPNRTAAALLVYKFKAR